MLKLGEGEVTIQTFRKHWFEPAMRTFLFSVLFFVPILVFLFAVNRTFSSQFGEFTLTIQKPSIAVFFVSIWGLFLWLSFFNFWSSYNLDGWVLTNKRIIDINQNGFFRREVSSFRLERLQDIEINVRGFIATMLKFGEIRAQTAGADKEFIFTNAADPNKVKEIILKQCDLVIESAKRNNPDSVASGE